MSETRLAPTRGGPLQVAVRGFVRAWRTALARRRLALALYLPGLLLALVSTAPLFGGLAALAAAGLPLDGLVAGDYLNPLIELAGPLAADRAWPNRPPGSEPGQAPAGLLLAPLVALVAIPLHGLLYTFLSGGLLAALLGHEGPFWAACRHRFWPLLRLSLLGWLPSVGLFGLGLTLLSSLDPDQLERPLLPLAGLLAALLYLNGLLELARADLVTRGDRRAWRALVRALALPTQPGLLLTALLLWLGLALLGAALLALGAALPLLVPAAALAAAFVVQQALALLGAWLKLLRLAVAVELVRSRQTPRLLGARLSEGEEKPPPRARGEAG